MPAFISNSNKLAYQLNISHKDASQELLLELLDHRLRTWTNKEVILAIQRDLPSLKWRIKYAAKDYYRRVNKLEQQELTKSQMLANMESQSTNEAETLEALNVLPNLLKNANSRNWCVSLLRFGKLETMMLFNESTKQFDDKLSKTCKYARQHQRNRLVKDNSKELKVLKEWDTLMDNESTDDNDIQTFIDQHKEYINEVINSPQVAYQGRLIKGFAHAGKDRYTLANLMTAREKELYRRTNNE